MPFSQEPPQGTSSYNPPQKPVKHAKPFSSFAEELHTHHNMPTNRHGMYHSGSLGLFDDPDEIEAAERRRDRHEIEHHQAQIRRMQRQDEQDKRQRLKEDNQAKRISQGKSPRPWYSRMFGRSKEERGEAGLAGSGARGSEKVDESSAGGGKKEYEYVIVRRPSTPEVTYTEDDIDAVDSPWLEACSMVRVKSDDYGGCHIVPKSSIQSRGKKEQ
ncbi:hypothetical protein T440DRAFT_124964 [Plenodomus tracheiphilus IPT5]|uniref:Uncharacterized protein n=1 Tax=Plenodomus tracheiphilus IPT5 TaxID=1408161 RepID=A0A6A7B2M2_9PLEO|nr:hypothetical protein T440DRAFT_124964 [Plenodomus tracheiphilus IPT5]